MKRILSSKVSVWYAEAVTVAAGCLTSIFSCKAIMVGATGVWRVVVKATILAACVAAGLLLGAFAFDAMRNKENTLPYFAAMFLVGVTIFIVKFFYVV